MQKIDLINQNIDAIKECHRLNAQLIRKGICVQTDLIYWKIYNKYIRIKRDEPFMMEKDIRELLSKEFAYSSPYIANILCLLRKEI